MQTIRIRSIGLILVAMILAPALTAQQSSSTADDVEQALAFQNQMPERSSEAYVHLHKVVELDLQNATLEETLAAIAGQADLKLMYRKALLPADKKVSYHNSSMTVYDALWEVLDGTGIQFAISQNKQLVLLRMQDVERVLDQEVQETVRGRVIDAQTGEALPGVNIVVEGTTTGTSTISNGQFELTVPSLNETLTFSYVGYVPLEVPLNGRSELDIEMESEAVVGEEVMVTSYRRGQAQAISRQREAPNIINVIDEELIATFPDPNVGEILKRVPGINVQHDQGEARYVQIRGTSPSFSNVSINGEQVATPEGGERAITLDMIPSDLMAEIEVTKAITPDMDANAIGGSVNFVTKSAVDQRVFNVTLNGFYHNQIAEISPFGGRISANYGDRVGDDEKFGYMFGVNYNTSPIGNDDNEMEYENGTLELMELRNYELTRDRMAASSNIDYRFSDDSRLFANASYNFFDDSEVRKILLLESTEILREYSDRLEKNKIFSSSIGGEHSMNNGFNIDYRASYSYSDQNTPYDNHIIYRQAWEDQDGENISFIGFDRSDPDFPQFVQTNDAPASAGAANYSAFDFDMGENEDNTLTSEQHISTQLNVSKEYFLSNDINGLLKFGGLTRFKSKDQEITVNVYDGYGGNLTYEDLIGDFEKSDYLFGNYQIGLFPTRSSLRDFIDDPGLELHEDDTAVESNGEDYEATEDTYAGYVMTNLQIGGLGVLVGVRYEHLVTDYTGTVVEFDENEEISLSTTSGSNASGYLFPMIHLKYSIGNQANLRFAWTNNFSKPDYEDLVPLREITRLTEEIDLGNPELEPARATNFDLMGEYYLGTTGILSGGLFYKQIQDYIYTRSYNFQEAPYTGYRARQPVNGADADLFGFELAYQHNFTFLPGFAEGFGIFSNYTYTWSEARIPNEDGTDRTLRLPGQAGDVANFALSYEKYGFSGRVALNYSAAFIESVRGSADDDRYYDDHFQIDVSASQYITNNIQIFADIVNLTNEPTRFYNGVTTRPEQQEYYSWWSRLGVKLNF